LDGISAVAEVSYFHRIAGTVFTPRRSDTEYEYGGSGCLTRKDNFGDSYFYADLQIPDGAILDYLRVYYYDTSALNMRAALYSYDGYGNYTLITEVTGSGTAGYGSMGSGFFSYQVDTENEALVVLADFDGSTDSTLRFCGVRFRYSCSPPSCVYLPLCGR